MAIDFNNTPNLTTTPPAVFVEKLSFRYRSLDENLQPKRKKSTPETETIELPQTIEDISFSLPAGKLMLIAGPSGCGKSTLIKCLNGLIPHSYKGTLSGEIQLHGRSIKGQSLRDLALQVGTMLQDPDKQILGSTVEQEIAFGMENLGTPRDRDARPNLERPQSTSLRTISRACNLRAFGWSAPTSCSRRFTGNGTFDFSV